MKPKLYATVSKNKTVMLNRAMKEQDCNKIVVADFIAEYYSKM
ncbi:MAG: hypothetical protein QCH31_11145 [Methanolobus sp.]|nr:hypothetical protein [Methanolobus sp.]